MNSTICLAASPFVRAGRLSRIIFHLQSGQPQQYTVLKLLKTHLFKQTFLKLNMLSVDFVFVDYIFIYLKYFYFNLCSYLSNLILKYV